MAQRDFEDYPRPSLAVDPAVLTVHDGTLSTLLWRRENPPEAGTWALPGVFVNEGEELEGAVARALRTKAHLQDVSYVEQLFTWNKVNRDPRGWVVTVAYFAMASWERVRAAVLESEQLGLFALQVEDGHSGPVARTIGVDGHLIKPAFDHDEILGRVVMRLRERLWHSQVGLAVLPSRFTLREMQSVYEAIMGERFNKDSFRRRVTKTQRLVRPTGKYQEDVDHRPAELFAGVRAR